MNQYQKLVQKDHNDLEEKCKIYATSPHLHPKYCEERVKFLENYYRLYHSRKTTTSDDEMELEFKNHWNIRMMVFYKEKIEEIRREKAKTLGLNSDATTSFETMTLTPSADCENIPAAAPGPFTNSNNI